MPLPRFVPHPRSLLLALCFAPALLLPLTCFTLPRFLALNTSPSLPVGLYLLTDEPLSRGRLVVVCLPEDLTAVGTARGYFRPSPRCPGFSARLLKAVAALPGDRVMLDTRVHVQSTPLPASDRHRLDSRGALLGGLPSGAYCTPEGYLWVTAPHGRSWDSRYWGPLPAHHVVAMARPLLVLR